MANQERDPKTGLDIGLPMVSKWDPEALEKEKQELVRVAQCGPLGRLAGYVRLSGPGWLQAALTLGGGSSSASLWAGALLGYSILWSQPFAMVIGIIMMMALAHQTLSTRIRPFQAVERFAHPALAWGWALSSLIASIIWSLPQFSLCRSVVDDVTRLANFSLHPLLSAGVVVAITLYVTWNYGKSGRGIRLFEFILKFFVGAIILSFLIVVIRTGISWRHFWKGMCGIGRGGFGFHVPDDPGGLGVLITGAATAVGINMTFLFPYTLLARGWGREHRQLAKYDLALGMFIPFVLATSFIVIASANTLNFEYHAKTYLLDAQKKAVEQAEATKSITDSRDRQALLALFDARIESLEQLRGTENHLEKIGAIGIAPGRLTQFIEDSQENLRNTRLENSSLSDETIGNLLKAKNGDAFAWHRADIATEGNQLSANMRKATYMATSLEGALGPVFSHLVFGLGIFGMVVSSIIMLMLVSGFIMAELTHTEVEGTWYRVGLCLPAVGIVGPLVWGKFGFWMAIPTSSVCFLFLPIAYVSFFILNNNKEYLGEDRPEGNRRLLWNIAMGIAILVVTIGGAYNIWKNIEKVIQKLAG